MAPTSDRPVPDDTTGPTCTACSHALQRHDAVARRYCDATTLRSLDRHCLCAA